MANIIAIRDKALAGRIALGGNPIPGDIAKGTTGSPTNCPLANTFRDLVPGVNVGGSVISGIPRNRAHAFAAAIGGQAKVPSYGNAEVTLPQELRQFVSEFDTGRFPEYSDRY